MTSQGGEHPKCYLSPPAPGATTSEQPSPSPQGPPVFSHAVLLYIHICPVIWATTHPISDACQLFSTIQPMGSSLLPTELGWGISTASVLKSWDAYSFLCQLLPSSEWPRSTTLILTLPLPGISSGKCLQMCKKRFIRKGEHCCFLNVIIQKKRWGVDILNV